MLIPLNDIILIYEKILQELNIDYVSVVIYTAVDIDSLCSLKILTKFFKSQSIHYKIYPVTTYTELQKRIEDTREYETVKLFMFINCGGFIDLTDKWFVSEQGKQAKVFLFDVNKPINHKNLESQSILIIDDEHSDLQNRITSQDMTKLEQLNDFDLDQEVFDQQNEDDDEDNGNGQSPKRRARTQLNQKIRKHKEIIEKKIINYYGNTFFSLPTSYCLYRLIRDLHKASNYSLWFAIVGMTSMYLENTMPKEILETLTNFYRSDMVKFNPQNTQRRQKGQIFVKKGYQFPLMNHWSLYESMTNSSYLNIHLGLWNDKGINKQHEILTKIGISLDQSKQQYKYMLKELKDGLEQRIFTIAEWYGLNQIAYESFMKQTDTSSTYMASDYYYIITAILEKSLHKSSTEELSEHRIECFWEAYSMLDGSQEMIRKAVQQYKEMSVIFMKEAKDIIERDNIININKVNFSNIRCDTKEKRLFQHPCTLIRLAHMLMGIQKQRKTFKNSTPPAIPYVISLFDIDKNECLVVGVTPQMKNDMGNKFNSAVTKLNMTVRHDKFMSNIMIIPKDNLLQFIKEVGNRKNQ